MDVVDGQVAGLWGDLATLRSRLSFRFSATGRSAAAFVADGCGAAYVEYWTCGSDATCRALLDTWTSASTADRDGVPTDTVPSDDGEVLLVRRRGGGHELHAAHVRGGIRSVGAVAADEMMTLPPASPGGPTHFIGRTAGDEASLWRLDSLASHPHRVATLPRPRLVGGGSLDPMGRHIAVNLEDGARVLPVRVNTGTGAHEPLVDPAGDASYQVVATSTTGRVLLATDVGGRWQFADLPAAAASPVILTELEAVTGDVRPLTFDPTGRRVLLNIQRGLRNLLAVFDLDERTLTEISTPDGSVGVAGAWVIDGDRELLRFVLVSASAPFRLATIDLNRPGDCRLQDDGTPGNVSDRWAAAHVEELPGATGPVEAIVHGHADWRSARHVLIALHGGPERAWLMKFHQLFQYFAGYGITVIAPNPRGSSGYGEAHQEAIRGAWAGPDLADVLTMSEYVQSTRIRTEDRLLLYGHSYGAYLALVAAAAAPGTWSRVVAVAPFLSGPRLRAEASEPVRRMLDRLGACRQVDDALGPRDLIRLAGRIRSRVLVVHGEDDPIIPVTQSRALRDQMLRLHGASDRFQYQEVVGAGHNPLDGSERAHDEVARFLRGLPTGDLSTSLVQT